MVSLLNKIINFFSVDKKKDRVLTHLNPDIEENKIIKEQAKKIQSLQSEKSEGIAIKREKKELEKQKGHELDFLKELKKKEIKLKKQETEGIFELNKIFDYVVKHKKKELELTDKDDKKVFDYFKSFVVMPNGIDIGIRGKSGEVWAYGNTINHIIFKPESLKNHIRRGRIPLPYDEEGNFIPDLEKIFMREIKVDEKTGEARESDVLMLPVKQMIISRERENSRLRKDKEYLEKLNNSLSNKLKEFERSFEILKTKGNLNDSELSIALKGVLEQSKSIGSMVRTNANLEQQKLMAEEMKESFENLFDKHINEYSDDKTKTALRKAKDEWIRDFQMAEKYGRKTVINQGVEESKETIKEGEPMGKK